MNSFLQFKTRIRRSSLPLYKSLFCEARYYFLPLVMILSAIGLYCLFSASSTQTLREGVTTTYKYITKQLIWYCFGVIGCLIAAKINLEKFRRHIPKLYFLVIVLLLVSLLMPSQKGAVRWIRLGFINIQTGELAKIAIVIFLANYFDVNATAIQKQFEALKRILVELLFRMFFIKHKVVDLTSCLHVAIGLFPLVFFTFLPIALIIAQQDLGTPGLIMVSVLFIAYAGGVKFRYIFISLLACVSVLTYYILSEPYRINRMLTFLNPMYDPQGKSHQIITSYTAISAGGIFGCGSGASTLKLILPEHHTDFIFSIIAEEFGLLSLIIPVLFFFFMVSGNDIAKKAKNIYQTLIAFGFTTMIVMQAYFNICVCIGLAPAKGIALPFFSYGGSSLMSTLIMVGFILNVYLNEGNYGK